MMAGYQVLAIDLGAQSGRVMRVTIDGKSLHYEQVHRFVNRPVTVRNILHWDILALWGEIQIGIEKASTGVSSLGIDTWGVDFALLDAKGDMISNPVHYRDDRTQGMMDWVFERIPKAELFKRTGIQMMPINTLFQLASLIRSEHPSIQYAKTLLTIPDLLNYWLTGKIASEYTIATTTQLLDIHKATWDTELLALLDIPAEIFPDIVQPGTRMGTYQSIPVIAPACHDTGSAVVAVPTTDKNFAYISSGTWSLVGLELGSPLVNDQVYDMNLTNEGGVNRTMRLLKNVAGLWLLEQCRETWAQDKDIGLLGYTELGNMADGAPGFIAFFDPDHADFLTPGDIPARIQAYCQRTGQNVPDTKGRIVRVIFESLALKYRSVLDQLASVSGRKIDVVHIVGGGSNNDLLNQMTANATGCTVVAGPSEATATGNAIVQLIAAGEIADLAEARTFLREGIQTKQYEPQQIERWQAAYDQYKQLAEKDS